MIEITSGGVFAAIANPVRRRILEILRESNRTAGDLVSEFPVLPQPAVSRHLRILRIAGLVNVTQKAQQRVYSLRPKNLKEVDAWISMYRQFWSDRLDSLSSYLEEEQQSSNKIKDRESK